MKKTFFQSISNLPLLWKILLLLSLLSILLFLVNLYLLKQNKQYFPWNNIEPGITTLDQLRTNLGEPVSTKTNGSQTEYGFTSTYPSFPNQVVTENSKVKFVREWVSINPPKLITEYVQILGEPEYTTDAIDSGYKLYAYPSKGIAIDFHNATGEVYHILHFQRTSVQQFIQDYKQFISTDNEPRGF